MKEEFLYFLWNNRLLNFKKFEEQTGISFIQYGIRNTNAGPDYSQVKFSKDGIIWAGAIEMHVRSGDWNLHFHHQDLGYNNVILHLVWEHNQAVFTATGDEVFTLSIVDFVPEKYIQNQVYFFAKQTPLYCADEIKNVSNLIVRSMLENTFIERVEQKSWVLQLRYSLNSNDLQETIYQTFAFAWGLKINAEPFEELAKRIPTKICNKHKGQTFQLLALFLGTAGFLEEQVEDDYFLSLQKEYRFLKAKYAIQPMLKESWLKGKVFYPYFPVFSIVLFVHWIQNINDWQQLVFQFSTQKFSNVFEVKLDSYWQQHFDFKKPHVRSFSIGASKIETLILNAVLPITFFYGRILDQDVFEDIELIAQNLPIEKNAITKHFQPYINLENGKDSQAVIELFKKYCEPKKCLNCRIGNEILKR